MGGSVGSALRVFPGPGAARGHVPHLPIRAEPSETLIPRLRGRYAEGLMNRHGSFKLTYRSPATEASYLDPLGRGLGRAQRIVDSLRCQILDGSPEQALRIRQIFSTPREIFRVEIVEGELNYSRTTLLDRDALEDLLETEGVRERVLEGSST